MSTYEVTVRFRVEAESVEDANDYVSDDLRGAVYRPYQIEDTETHEIGEAP